MNRVIIVGCSGAGKSVFARRLGERTGLPVVHLDKVYWRAGWTESDSGEWRIAVAELIAEPRWILDGNYGSTLETRLLRADTVFFFDMPRWLSLVRVVRRTLRDYGRTRADLAEGCPERFDWSFLKYIWSFHRKHRPKTIMSLNAYRGEIITFRSRADVAAYLHGLAVAPTARVT